MAQTEKQIVAKLRQRPKTAPELGVTINDMRRLERRGLIVRTGETRGKGRGRPAIVFAAA